MEKWEFVLQKQGDLAPGEALRSPLRESLRDRHWQVLKMPILEIEEGKYRILAQCDRSNEDVEVRLTHQDSSQDKSLLCYQKRLLRTNTKGLIVIVPFIYFSFGCWELSCCSDLMSELLGQSWFKYLQLQVIPKRGGGSIGRYRNEYERKNRPREATFFSSLPLSLETTTPSINLRIQQARVSSLFTYPLEILNFQPQNKSKGAISSLLCESPMLFVRDTLGPLAAKRLKITRLLGASQVFNSYIANYLKKDEQLYSYSELSLLPTKATLSLNLDLPELPKMKKVMVEFPSLSQQVLPPKIIRSASSKKAIKLPKLPQFSPPPQSQLSRAPLSGSRRDRSTESDRSQSISFNVKVKSKNIPRPSASSQNNSATAKAKYASIDKAFDDLKLRERFWFRLNSLAHNDRSLY